MDTPWKATGGQQLVDMSQDHLLPDSDWRATHLRGERPGHNIIDAIKKGNVPTSKRWPQRNAWKTDNKEMLDKTMPEREGLSEQEREDFITLLFAFNEIIAENPKCPSLIKGVVHRIPFRTDMDVRPYAAKMRRLSPAERMAQDKETQQLIDGGLIRPSSSPWSANVVMVPKKDGGLRYAIDYRFLNRFCAKDKHPLPNIHDVLEAAGGGFRDMQGGLPTVGQTTNNTTPLPAWGEAAKKVGIMSSFDVAAGFFGCAIAEEDRYKTAFSTQTHGQYEWCRMSMGLIGSSSTFQRMMQHILRGLNWRICVAYVDDVCMFSASAEAHCDDLALVFERLAAANVSIKFSKCHWGTDKLELLGHLVVAGKGVLPDPGKVQAMAEITPPSTVAELKSLLGASGFFRRFIPGYAAIVKPLRTIENKLKTKTSPLEGHWNKAAQNAFELVRAAMCNAPILTNPDFRKPMLIVADASKHFIGAALCQLDEEGVERPIAFVSRELIPRKSSGVSPTVNAWPSHSPVDTGVPTFTGPRRSASPTTLHSPPCSPRKFMGRHAKHGSRSTCKNWTSRSCTALGHDTTYRTC